MNIDDILYRFNLIDLDESKSVLVHEAAAPKHLHIELLKSVDEFIKKNPSTKEITSPIFFQQIGKAPNPEGLLSNEIFGITKEQRSGIYGYIDLHNYFLHPLVYKKLIRLDKRFRDIVHGIDKFSISPSGELIKDENGNTGIKWLKNNLKNIKIKSTDSDKRDDIIKFINENIDRCWTNKLLVLPAYYRDVNTEAKGKVSVGEINNIYASILISVKGIKETQDYGLPVSDSINGRIQELIMACYDWFSGNANASLEGSTGLSKKLGLIRRAGISKTTDFGSRLVMSAPELKVENIEDLNATLQYSSIPLASICANFEPYMIYTVKKFFENEFAPGSTVKFVDKDGKISDVKVKDPMIQFSDDRIKEELKRFIHGYSNRLIPISAELENGKVEFMKFKGRSVETPGQENIGDSSLINRRITWCDVFYIAACEVTKDKHVLITRYPIDSMYNQFPTGINVASTVDTEPVFYEGELYKRYPKITEEMIGSDTSNIFIDTLNISNVFLKRITGDYDGDQISSKGVFTKEANQEIEEFIHSKANYIGLNGKCSLITTNESIQSMYNLTKTLPGQQLNEMKF